MKKYLIFGLIAIIFAACHSQKIAMAPNNKSIDEERTKLKNYAFCSCLTTLYKMQDSGYKKKIEFLAKNNTENVDSLIKRLQSMPPNSPFIQAIDSLFVKDGSLSGYFQTGLYNLGAYDTISNLVNAVNDKVYKSYDQKNLVMMKCIDFYNSQALQEAIRKLDYFLQTDKLKNTK